MILLSFQIIFLSLHSLSTLFVNIYIFVAKKSTGIVETEVKQNNKLFYFLIALVGTKTGIVV